MDYNPELDQILLSVHNFNEIWIIDHNTTTTQTVGPDGDLLYRWGNPQAYGAGIPNSQQLFVQHDAQWIEHGLPGEGNILIFNYGSRRNRPYSSIEEITPALNVDGSYNLIAGRSYGPIASTWTYVAETATDFYAMNISGAQRLPNGNTLICDGPSGKIFEVTPVGETIWKYVTPFGQGAPEKDSIANGPKNLVFRAIYYQADYAGFAGKYLEEIDLGVSPDQSTQDQSPPQSHGTRNQTTSGQRRPRSAALEACSGLSLGAACSLNSPKGRLAGSCLAYRTQLVCKPQGVFPRKQIVMTAVMERNE